MENRLPKFSCRRPSWNGAENDICFISNLSKNILLHNKILAMQRWWMTEKSIVEELHMFTLFNRCTLFMNYMFSIFFNVSKCHSLKSCRDWNIVSWIIFFNQIEEPEVLTKIKSSHKLNNGIFQSAFTYGVYNLLLS